MIKYITVSPRISSQTLPRLLCPNEDYSSSPVLSTLFKFLRIVPGVLQIQRIVSLVSSVQKSYVYEINLIIRRSFSRFNLNYPSMDTIKSIFSQIPMNKYTYIIIALAIAIIAGVFYYTSPTQQWARQEKSYQEEINKLIQQNSSIEKGINTKLETINSLSGQIQTDKGFIKDNDSSIEKLQLCIKSKSVDCIKASKTAMLQLIPWAYASEPQPWYKQRHSIVITGSHDYRIYSDRNGAGWKNNNPSGITWGVSNTLKDLWDTAWIKYSKWTPRPANEKWYYIFFNTVEDGLHAKMIAIRNRWSNATVTQYLAWWGTDNIVLSFDTSKKISDLTDGEFMELFVNQLKKETPGYISQLVSDGILVIQ